MTQTEQILKTLQDGFTVTALDALRDFQCFRLSARILELKDEGWPIAKKMVKVKSGKKIASYYLEFAEWKTTYNYNYSAFAGWYTDKCPMISGSKL